jgi:hypothetical protein
VTSAPDGSAPTTVKKPGLLAVWMPARVSYWFMIAGRETTM